MFTSIRAVGLAECLKNQTMLAGGNSHAGVDHSEMQEAVAGLAADFEAHGSGFSELDRVA